jgi:hypothetical protein
MRSDDSLPGAARLAAIVATWIVIPIVALALKGGPHLSHLDLFVAGLFAGFLFGLPLTYLGVLLIGYPAYKLLLAYDYLNVWSLCTVGATTGALSADICWEGGCSLVLLLRARRGIRVLADDQARNRARPNIASELIAGDFALPILGTRRSVKKAPPLYAAGQLSRRTIMSTALCQAVSFGVSASRRRVSPELRVPFVV